MKIFGISELSLRLPSMVFSLFSVFLIYKFGCCLFNSHIGLLSALFMCLSPFHLWYAQEARPYSLSLFFGMLSNYFLYSALNEKKKIFWLGYIFATTAGFYCDYFFILLLITQGFYCLFLKRKLISFLISALVTLVIFSPWIPGFLNKFSAISKGFWIPSPDISSFAISLENFLLGYNVSQRIYWLGTGLICLVVIAAFSIVIKDSRTRKPLIFCFFFLACPLILAYLISLKITPIYLDRKFIIFSPYLYLILSFGIVQIQKLWMKTFLLAGFCIILISGVFAYFSFQMPTPFRHHIGVHLKRPIRPVVEFLKINLNEGDLLAFTNPSIVEPFTFYSRNKIDFSKIRLYYFYDPFALDFPSYPRAYQENEFYKPKWKIRYLGKIIWVLFCDWPRQGNISENGRRVKEQMDKDFNLYLSKQIEGVWVYKYELKELDR
jgi:hypothetical protein